MVQVTVERGIPLEVLVSRITRENGLHVIKVHNGVITHHGLLKRVQTESWVVEEMEEAEKEAEEEE